MGTPHFAIPSLKILVESGYDVVGVVTALVIPEPDVPVKKREYKTSQYARFVLFFFLY